jgi:hypothetical protein
LCDQCGRRDPATCREDLIRRAAQASLDFDWAFHWINEREEFRVTENPANQGLTALAIRELAREWIINGGQIRCVAETREGYRDTRHYHYDITIHPLGGFPRGLYVYMELANTDEDDPTVNLLNAHPPSR